MKNTVLNTYAIIFLSFFFFTGCPENEEDAIMFHIYHSMHEEIKHAVQGTDLDPSYLAALISLESHPPGNRKSERFEKNIYERLVQLKQDGRKFGFIERSSLNGKSDRELREFATSYGLTQIMGFHCIELGCTPEDLKGKYHLQWAAAWMQKHYGRKAKQKNWPACFRIHNTGHPGGETYRKDYVERGLARMAYYNKWIRRKGNLFSSAE
ncbi:MAG: N-acetylmuramidase family protein [Spirochaetia bacterium]|nr:N-acetylmuramidase family protein [Spirochaetia bacterium]